MKKAYIIISQSGSIVSKCIKVCTKKDFNHCSITLDPKLASMCSMGRIFPNNPLIGGLVIEKPNYGTYKKFHDTCCMVIEFPIQDEQYNMLESRLNMMLRDSKHYSYNYAGLFLGYFGIKHECDDAFMCSEFVKHVLEKSSIDVSFLPEIPHPMDFLNITEGKIIYQGKLNDLGHRPISDMSLGIMA